MRSSLAPGPQARPHSPLEEEEVQVVVLLGEEVAQDAGRVAAADLVGGKGEVDALDEVPQLRHRVLAEHPGETGAPAQGTLPKARALRPQADAHLSVTAGRMKNIHRWTASTSTTWKASLPSTVLRR